MLESSSHLHHYIKTISQNPGAKDAPAHRRQDNRPYQQGNHIRTWID
jgi:hypothetical protein